jgi:hypothetical protein
MWMAVNTKLHQITTISSITLYTQVDCSYAHMTMLNSWSFMVLIFDCIFNDKKCINVRVHLSLCIVQRETHTIRTNILSGMEFNSALASIDAKIFASPVKTILLLDKCKIIFEFLCLLAVGVLL